MVSFRLTLAALTFALVAGASSAQAAEWTRSTVNGGQITRSVTGDGYVASGTTTRTGPNGGSYSSGTTCVNGWTVDRCHRDYSATTANGDTYYGHRTSARGPYQVRTTGVWTGPEGNSVVGHHHRWR